MSILPVIGVMIGFAAIGLVLRARRWVDPSAAKALNTFVLDVTLPAGIFRSLHHFPLASRALIAPALAALMTLTLWGLGEVLARLLRLDRSTKAIFLLVVIFGNTAFVGYPVVSALFGDEGLARAVLIDQLGVEVLAFTLGAVLATTGAQAGGRIDWGAELRSLLRFPPLLTLAAALAWQGFGLPQLGGAASTVLGAVSALTAPAVMVSLGLVLRLGSLRRVWRLALLVSALRLLVSPAIMWLAGSSVGLTGLDRAVATAEFAMPAMMFNLVLALRYGLDAELTAGLITATLLGSVLTLPFGASLLRI